MSAIHDLIAQISDPRLRERLRAEWASATSQKKFGLVFEDHLPELLPLHNVKARKGDLVCRRDGALTDVWLVTKVQNGVVTCVKPSDSAHPSQSHVRPTSEVIFPIGEVLVVREFGAPIFPALSPVEQVSAGPTDAPWHTLIEADNYHALQLLTYLCPAKVDCIYIDPPYNSGASDWKYNNDYVDSNDSWRHSKWLSMMRRRLMLAKQLLKTSASVLLITIDDKELNNLSLLLDQLFPDSERQIVSITISPRGKSRDRRLSQVDEYLIVVYIGSGGVSEQEQEGRAVEVRWRYLRRNDVESARGTSKGGPNQFYPIYVDKKSRQIVKIGAPLNPEQDLEATPSVKGATAVFPIREDGKHMNWGLTGSSLQKALNAGFVRVTEGAHDRQPYTFAYLTAPNIKKIEAGLLKVTGTRADGSKIVVIPGGKDTRPTTAWRRNLHDAGTYGTGLLRAVLPDQQFPFPKSVYAVVDTLRLFVKEKPEALILDFFAGSGTTLNAVNLLNALDGGRRRCILVTNNEVSSKEAQALRLQGYQPGDDEWERHGICRSITWPRSKYTINGKRDDGSALDDAYLTGRMLSKDKARTFFQIGFLASEKLRPRLKKQFVALIDGLPQSYVTDNSDFIVSDDTDAAVLFEISAADEWLKALDGKDHITRFYIATSETRAFDEVRSRVVELLGDVLVAEEERRPMANGFPANAAYFRLQFLDKDRVTLRRAFREILSLLWIKAGAIGPPPQLKTDDLEPVLLEPKGSQFVVLLEESCFSRLQKCVRDRERLTHVFIVTDSNESFKAMASEVRLVARSKDIEVIHLYRDYLANFIINTPEYSSLAMSENLEHSE